MRFGETVVRLRARTAANPYSGEADAEDWADPARVEIRGVGFEPSGTETVSVDGIVVYRRARFLLPFGADVTEADRLLRPDGVTYRAVGPRADWTNPLTGRRAGSVIEAEAVG